MNKFNIKMNLLLSIVLFGFTSCSSVNPSMAGTKPISHEIFNSLLKKYVDKDGWVDYTGLQSEKAKLSSYLKLLKENAPNDDNWSKDEKLAYWINAYNAFTLDLVLQHYPLKSIRDIGSKIQVPGVNSPWDLKFIEIGGKKLNLNNIEHDIIRKNFNEPRIHFAVNCASYSCPLLRNEAFAAEKLDAQLEEQTRKFVNDPARNKITEKKAQLSKIFNWYGGDFTKTGTLKEFVNKYTDVEVTKATKISYLEYNWALNEN